MYHLIESINSEIIDSFLSADEAIDEYYRLADPDSLDPYYGGLVKNGGYLRIEDTQGNGIFNC